MKHPDISKTMTTNSVIEGTSKIFEEVTTEKNKVISKLRIF